MADVDMTDNTDITDVSLIKIKNNFLFKILFYYY